MDIKRIVNKKYFISEFLIGAVIGGIIYSFYILKYKLLQLTQKYKQDENIRKTI